MDSHSKSHELKEKMELHENGENGASCQTKMELHAKRRKIVGKGTGGREGYLLFFRQGLANLAVADLQVCSNHLQTSAEKVLNMNRTINSFLFQAYAPPYSKLP